MDGELPVNPSGGVLSTNPVGASGVIRVAEISARLMGRAGSRQVPGVRTTLSPPATACTPGGRDRHAHGEAMIDPTDEPLSVSLDMDLTWRYAAGDAMTRFLEDVGRGRLEASRCDVCGRRYLPPRPFCGMCRVRIDGWVAVEDTGVLEAWTVVHLPIRDGRTGEMRPSPTGWA